MGCERDAGPLEKPALEQRYLKQVHGQTIYSDIDYHGPDQQGDGLFTAKTGIALIVFTADCVPVHVTDGANILMLHAGWRGVKSGIVKRINEYIEPKKATVVLGPAISGTRYEVDRDLYEPWCREDPSISQALSPPSGRGTKRFLDLKLVITRQLEELGITSIISVPVCTFVSSLPSFRRDGTRDRIYNYAYRLTE
jgi:hypothetical protein